MRCQKGWWKLKWEGKCVSNRCYVVAPEETRVKRVYERSHLRREPGCIIADNVDPCDLPTLVKAPEMIELLKECLVALRADSTYGPERELVARIEEVLQCL
jgi:predicted amino acid dehydrogenase